MPTAFATMKCPNSWTNINKQKISIAFFRFANADEEE